MHEEVRPAFHTRLRSFLRLSSVAGQGLPERMRSTAFAFLGLTAAAGLALVAFFAQLGFPLLTPAPMPTDPSRANAVAEAEVVATNPGLGASVPALPQSGRAAQGASDDDAPQGPAQAQARDSEPADTPVASPPPVSSPGSGEGGVAAGPAGSPAPGPSPSPTPAGASEPATAPVAPKPAPAPSPKPEAPPAAEPAPVAGPGHSQSTAAASNASQRGIEASSKKSTAAPAPAPVTPSAAPSPAPAPVSPGNGNGKALGHGK